MGRLRAKTDYEEIRNARILENQARLACLGVQTTISELRSITLSAKTVKRKLQKVDYSSTPLRRSNRLKGKTCSPLRRSNILTGKPCSSEPSSEGANRLFSKDENDSEKRLPIKLTDVWSPIPNTKTSMDIYRNKVTDIDANLVETFKPVKNITHRSKNPIKMERLRAKTDYEELRNARILENQARLACLGVQTTISELRSITFSAKTVKRKLQKVDYSSTPLRRSNRLKGKTCSPLRRSNILTGKPCSSEPSSEGANRLFSKDENDSEKRPANAPLVNVRKGELAGLSPDALARRCASKGRGSLYDPTYGICCHFCRQKKLCGEEDCRRCANLELDQPCLGKTDCSVCHSSNGVFCRACLKVRYGEEIEDVRANEKWMCPHCVEQEGTKPYWICNSSICLNKRNIAPTGIAIYKAREMGYESVAHFLMDKLRKAGKT